MGQQPRLYREVLRPQEEVEHFLPLDTRSRLTPPSPSLSFSYPCCSLDSLLTLRFECTRCTGLASFLSSWSILLPPASVTDHDQPQETLILRSPDCLPPKLEERERKCRSGVSYVGARRKKGLCLKSGESTKTTTFVPISPSLFYVSLSLFNMASRSLPLLRAAARPVAALRTPVVARFVAPTRAAVSSRAFAMTASKFKAVESASHPLACLPGLSQRLC